MNKLQDYSDIVGAYTIDELKILAEMLQRRPIQTINSTAVGGGVAEILNRMVPLLKEMGVNIRWDVIKGGMDFFDVTEKFHNALHGERVEVTGRDYEVFLETSKRNIEEMEISGDIVFIHDPQPVALIKRRSGNKWIWRCHIDVSLPHEGVWNFVKGFVKDYDASVFSAPDFSHPLTIRQFLIAPSIDPLSDKNKDIPQETIDQTLIKYNLNTDKPIITQISRFDRLKDPLGVIEAYKLVKKYIDCQLVLAGGTAIDDPEGMKVYEEVQNRASGDSDIHVIIMPHNDIEVNALQRASNVIVQKSLKEGFGLTVTEALWKEKPVVASAVGGIPLQVKHKFSGLLCYSVEGAAFNIKQLLNNKEYASQLGKNGKEHVKNNYLLTRHLKDYMLVFLSLYYNKDIINLD
ncbi:MAG: glycosyltransferase [Candidatus Omnitrophica bacterium]|nr:glycosyltransferase [Candidatus Omnitrophota bacterium]